MEDLIAQGLTLVLLELGDLLEGGGILGDEGTSLQKGGVLGQADLAGKILDVAEESLAGDASKRILDAVIRGEALAAAAKVPQHLEYLNITRGRWRGRAGEGLALTEQ